MLKKTVFSVLATTTLATLIATGDAEASSNTYKVNSGDTLWRIALNNNVSVSDLKSWNNLSSDIIYPNQTLKVTGNKGTSSSNSSSSTSSSSSNSSSSATSKPSTSQTNTSVYTVKSGDTLGAIASRHNTTVAKLASLNGIRNTNYISVGQKIKIDGKASSSNNASASKPSTSKPSASKPNTSKPSTSKPSSNANSGSTASSSTYTVKSGDTLSHIAYNHGTTVSKLMSNNNLTSHMIYVGQKLSVNGKAASTSNNNASASKPSTSKPTTGASNSKPSTSKPSASGTGVYSSLINAGMKYQGVPYVWGGTSPSGFDCSGFIYYVHNQVGVKIPRTNTDGYYSRSFSVSNPIPGDLVFFKNTYKQGISHMGIYLGNGKFLHAGTSQGVTVGNVHDSYWGPKFAGYKRLYEVID